MARGRRGRFGQTEQPVLVFSIGALFAFAVSGQEQLPSSGGKRGGCGDAAGGTRSRPGYVDAACALIYDAAMNGDVNLSFDTAHLVVALVPLAIYFLLLAVINLMPRPLMISGTRDLAALAVGISGLVMMGPVQLFTPPPMLAQMGPYYWLLLVLLYGSAVSLWILFLRPRVVVYNIAPEQFRGIVSTIAVRQDPSARWAGNALEMPQARLLLKLEPFPAFRNVSLAIDSDQFDFSAWQRLVGELSVALAEMRVPRNPRGVTFGMIGTIIMGVLIHRCSQQGQALTESFIRLLGL